MSIAVCLTFLVVSGSALLSVACRPASPRAPPTAADTPFLALGLPPAQLPSPASRGAHLVQQYCSQCHGIPSPLSHSSADWELTLRRMQLRMERGHHMYGMGGMMRRGMGGGMGVAVPTAEEQHSILAYLQSHALRTIAPDSLPQAGEATSATFARVCGRCHALPSPRQHSAADWPAVVARMRANMRLFGVDTISDETSSDITRYLQRAAQEERPAKSTVGTGP